MNDSQPSATTSALTQPLADMAKRLESMLSSADAHYAREDWVAARDSLSLAVELAPNQPQIRAALGSLQYRLQDYRAACVSFTIATTQSPDNPDLPIQLAMVQLQLQQLEEAKTALQRSLSLHPINPTARQMLGDIHFAAKRYAEAVLQYCILLHSNPDGVNLLLQLGKCLHELRDLASARWCFERVIALEPANASASEAQQILAANIAA